MSHTILALRKSMFIDVHMPDLGAYLDALNKYLSRSQWPRCPRREPSSLARTLGSWVRIPLQVWMSVCVYSVFVILCVGSDLVTG
jgi:hypothetical protein